MCVFFKQKTAYEMRISDWSSDVCSSDLIESSSLRQRAAGKVECARHAGNGSSCAPVADRRDAPIAVGAAKLDQRNHIILSVPCRLRRSEEHTSELQSLMRISYAVFCLKKKNIKSKRSPQTCLQHRNPTNNI